MSEEMQCEVCYSIVDGQHSPACAYHADSCKEGAYRARIVYLESALRDEKELAKKAKDSYKELKQSLESELRDPNGTIWECAKAEQDRADRAEAALSRITNELHDEWHKKYLRREADHIEEMNEVRSDLKDAQERLAAYPWTLGEVERAELKAKATYATLNQTKREEEAIRRAESAEAKLARVCGFCEESAEDHTRPCGNCGDSGHAKWECVLSPEEKK